MRYLIGYLDGEEELIVADKYRIAPPFIIFYDGEPEMVKDPDRSSTWYPVYKDVRKIFIHGVKRLFCPIRNELIGQPLTSEKG